MNSFLNDISQDFKDVFFDQEEFAVSATLLCQGIEAEAKIIFSLDSELLFNNEFSTKAPFIYIQKNELPCDKPKIICEYGEFSTLYKEDDGSGIVKIYVSKDEVKKVEV